MSLDHRHLRLSFEADKLPLADKGKLLDAVEGIVNEITPSSWAHSTTGTLELAFRHGDEFGKSQATIVSASSFFVFAVVWIYLRSFPWAVLAMIPNAVALLLVFGVMGHWGISLNFGSAIVAPIAIGIAADDTIHFLTAYARERRSMRDPITALRRAISSVGEAVIATSIALALGFLSMIASPLPSISNIGLLGSVAIVGATVADLIVLPPQIGTAARWRGFKELPSRNG
jgi:predicted RND superfamily exporter protein